MTGTHTQRFAVPLPGPSARANGERRASAVPGLPGSRPGSVDPPAAGADDGEADEEKAGHRQLVWHLMEYQDLVADSHPQDSGVRVSY